MVPGPRVFGSEPKGVRPVTGAVVGPRCGVVFRRLRRFRGTAPCDDTRDDPLTAPTAPHYCSASLRAEREGSLARRNPNNRVLGLDVLEQISVDVCKTSQNDLQTLHNSIFCREYYECLQGSICLLNGSYEKNTCSFASFKFL